MEETQNNPYNLEITPDNAMPDLIGIVETDVVNQYRNAIDETVNQSDALAAALLADYGQAISSCKSICDSTQAGCVGCYYSVINDLSAKIGSVRDKLSSTVQKEVDRRIAIALEYVQSLG